MELSRDELAEFCEALLGYCKRRNIGASLELIRADLRPLGTCGTGNFDAISHYPHQMASLLEVLLSLARSYQLSPYDLLAFPLKPPLPLPMSRVGDVEDVIFYISHSFSLDYSTYNPGKPAEFRLRFDLKSGQDNISISPWLEDWPTCEYRCFVDSKEWQPFSRGGKQPRVSISGAYPFDVALRSTGVSKMLPNGGITCPPLEVRIYRDEQWAGVLYANLDVSTYHNAARASADFLSRAKGPDGISCFSDAADLPALVQALKCLPDINQRLHQTAIEGIKINLGDSGPHVATIFEPYGEIFYPDPIPDLYMSWRSSPWFILTTARPHLITSSPSRSITATEKALFESCVAKMTDSTDGKLETLQGGAALSALSIYFRSDIRIYGVCAEGTGSSRSVSVKIAILLRGEVSTAHLLSFSVSKNEGRLLIYLLTAIYGSIWLSGRPSDAEVLRGPTVPWLLAYIFAKK